MESRAIVFDARPRRQAEEYRRAAWTTVLSSTVPREAKHGPLLRWGRDSASWLPLLVILAAGACGDPSPFAPDPNQRLTGTYAFTVALSPSCPKRGSWKFRADIQQQGRDLDIKLYEGDFGVPFLDESFNHFRGQDQSDGVLFFAPGGAQGDTLFWEKSADTWAFGQSKGPFNEGRIDALFNGTGSGILFERNFRVRRA
jgi:hypothetical protein